MTVNIKCFNGMLESVIMELSHEAVSTLQKVINCYDCTEGEFRKLKRELRGIIQNTDSLQTKSFADILEKGLRRYAD